MSKKKIEQTDQPPLRLATRGSRLALWQADYVSEKLRNLGFAVTIQTVRTSGDRVQDRFLHEIGGKGLFVKEIEQALLDNSADLAIHSFKDMPAESAAGLEISAVLERHPAADAFILAPKIRSEYSLPRSLSAGHVAHFPELKVATGSLRRVALLRQANSRLIPVPIRGNVDTRIKKLEAGEWDALVIAEASLDRLQLGVPYSVLDPSWFIPSPAQGALALQTRSGDQATTAACAALASAATTRLVRVEREVLKMLGADCTMPLGCYAQTSADGSSWDVRAIVLSEKGSARCHVQLGSEKSPDEVARAVMTALQGNNLTKVLTELAEERGR